MKMTRQIVDLEKLSVLLKEGGFEGKTCKVQFGTIEQAGKLLESSIEPVGLILPDDKGKKVGFRHHSHRFGENPESPHLPDPRERDRVFFIAFQPPPDKETRKPRRPYAIIWGRLEDLPKSCFETESFFAYLFRGIKKWRRLPKIS